MKQLTRIFSVIPLIPWYAFLAYIVLCLALNVAIAPFVDYRYQWPLSSLGLLFLGLGLGLGALCCFSARKIPLPKPRSPFLQAHGFGLSVALGCLILLILQAIIMQGALYLEGDSDWAIMLALDDPDLLRGYYSAIPNNYFLGSVFVILGNVSSALGIANPVFAAATVGCLCVTASIAMGAFVARAIGGTKCGICAFLLMLVFIGLSPHIMVPYSDTYGMLFTTAILFFYTCLKHPAKWPIMTFIAYCGYTVKPTVLAIFGAAVLVSACLWLAHWREHAPLIQKKVLTFAGTLACSLVAVGLGIAVVAATEAPLDIQRNTERELVAAHYLMLGANDRYDGTFNSEDRSYSWQYAAPTEMTEADLSRWQSRMRAMGPGGVLGLLVKKNLINYNNGDMMFNRLWTNQEGDYYGTNPLIMAFYGIQEPVEGAEIEEGNTTVTPWQCIAQTLWFMVLVGIALCFFRRSLSAPEMAMAFALLLLSGFLLIFECSARYLFLYMPFYVILAVRGWQALTGRFARKRIMQTT